MIDSRPIKTIENTNHKNALQNSQDENKEKGKIEIQKSVTPKRDPILILLVIGIVGFLSLTVYFLLGYLSIFALVVGGGISTFYLLRGVRKSNPDKIMSQRKGVSGFILFIFGSPLVVGFVLSFEGLTLLDAPLRIVLLWSLIISFWTTILFIPLAVASKRREKYTELTSFPKVSIIIPAYNEEKVIKETIEALLETKYPAKEIIFVDDGSTDNTYKLAHKYSDKIKVLHKSNGGKASALNYGLFYAKGEIVLIVDADTIVGRHSISEIIKSFDHTDVAGVAGNVKVKNRNNWITKAQALEYIIGIQIVRRAFDKFGSITIVPGALGAFRKPFLKGAGIYGKETIVEDFDQTIKILKSGLVTQGNSNAVAYTESPDTLKDFIAQRKRWYRGNIQVVNRHSNAFINPRFGYLQKLSFPYMLVGMFLSPIIGFVLIASVILSVFFGDWLFAILTTLIFTGVHFLITALAIRLDNEDYKLLPYSILLVFGIKQIIDLLLLKAIFEELTNKEAKWTSASRIGVLKSKDSQP